MSLDLLSTTSRVEAPFIIAKIAGHSFGLYNSAVKNVIDETGSYNAVLTEFPNYMQSLAVKKINGTFNSYTLTMVYAIRDGDDPNMLEKVFSKAKNDRKMYLTYGDCSSPSFIFKEEETMITDIKSTFNIASSSITYTISAISSSLGLKSGTYNFPACEAKPSDKIKEILYSSQYNLLSVFSGMYDKEKVLSRGLIASNDVKVKIEAQQGVTIINYLNYLVSCMRSASDTVSGIKKSTKYGLVIVDDITGDWGGTYFKVTSSNLNNQSYNNIYEIDVGYNSSNIVTSFTIDSNDVYSILYDYSDSITKESYVYRLNDDGEYEQIYSPNITQSSRLMKTTESDRTWWSNMTQFPITATLVIKGLLKPAVLMTELKVNVLFYGRKHISSGYYSITEQNDLIDASGFKTTLKLLKIKGDD